jgi:hypothetical protein
MTISNKNCCTIQLLFIILLIAAVPFKISGELISSERYGYTIDFPEGFSLENSSDDESAYQLIHTLIPVHVIIKIWPDTSYTSAEKALTGTLSKLSATTTDMNHVIWRNEDCMLAQFTMQYPGTTRNQSGWSCCMPLPGKNAFFVLLSFTDSDKEQTYEQFTLSVLDSVMIDQGSLRESGIVTAYAYPRTKPENISFTVGPQTISTQIDENDIEGAQFVIQREFAVFKLFVQTDLWKEAWQRFYRQIARDSFQRLKRPAFDLYTQLLMRKTESESGESEAVFAQTLLSWIQTLPYERVSANPDHADFTGPTAILCGKGSDCDSRSMLLAIILKNMDVNSCIFISKTYSHAMAGIDLPGKQGQKMKAGTTDFLVAETIDKNVTIGMMRATMSDRNEWIPVELP